MMSKHERVVIVFFVMAIVLVVLAIVANALNAPWLMVSVPIAYLVVLVISRKR